MSKAKMGKVKRFTLIGLAVGAVLVSSIACDEDTTSNTSDTIDLQPIAYQAIQDGQNAIKEAGQAVKDSDLNESLTFEEIWEAIP